MVLQTSLPEGLVVCRGVAEVGGEDGKGRKKGGWLVTDNPTSTG